MALGGPKHAKTELFQLSSAKWQIKNTYPYSMDIYMFSIIAFEKKFIIFGGRSLYRTVLKNRDISRYLTEDFYLSF